MFEVVDQDEECTGKWDENGYCISCEELTY